VSPILKWGLGVGFAIVLLDAAGVFASRSLPLDSDARQYVDLADNLANIVLFSLAGLRVGRETGIVRAAAEAGVLAGAVAGAVASLYPFLLPDPAGPPPTLQTVVEVLAWNIAMGGVLALLNGWIGSRSAGKPSR